MLHLYWGDGKGKTTAAMGLALRALGHGRRVVVLQFLKDGTSGEIALLRRCGAEVHACPNAKFTWLMTEAERTEARQHNTAALRAALDTPFDLLVLDEACAACRHQLVDEALLRQAAAMAKQGREVVLTGRDPAPWMQEAADYSTVDAGGNKQHDRAARGPAPLHPGHSRAGGDRVLRAPQRTNQRRNKRNYQIYRPFVVHCAQTNDRFFCP